MSQDVGLWLVTKRPMTQDPWPESIHRVVEETKEICEETPWLEVHG